MSRPPRLHGFDYRGRHCYFLTICTFQRRDTFRDSAVARMASQQFQRAGGRYGFAILAYCVMPDHVHLLVEGTTARADLRRFVKSAKQSAGQIHAARARKPLWQESYYDHIVRPEEDLRRFAKYIIENPVRAGLARTAEEYPHAGCVWSRRELESGD